MRTPRRSSGRSERLDRSGAVKALVGGRDYARSQFNRAVNAHRQPGSAFKPFVYLAALERGLTPNTMRVDEPVRIGKWAPKNYSKSYRGPVSLTEALSLSLNTVAAKLADEVGPRAIIRSARKLGITSPMQSNLSIALGTSEVTPLEIAAAYVPFSNGGYAIVPHVIRSIRTSDGKLLYARQGDGAGRVIDHSTLSTASPSCKVQPASMDRAPSESEERSNRRQQQEHVGVFMAEEVPLPLTSLNGFDLQMVEDGKVRRQREQGR